MGWSTTAQRWWAALTARRGARRTDDDDDRAGMGTAFGLDASFEGWDDDLGDASITRPAVQRPGILPTGWT